MKRSFHNAERKLRWDEVAEFLETINTIRSTGSRYGKRHWLPGGEPQTVHVERDKFTHRRLPIRRVV